MISTRQLLRVLSGVLFSCSAGLSCHAQLLLPKAHTQPSPYSAKQTATGSGRRSGNRFLGWKYAAMAHQDTSEWIRKPANAAAVGASPPQHPSPRIAHATNTTTAADVGLASAPTRSEEHTSEL